MAATFDSFGSFGWDFFPQTLKLSDELVSVAVQLLPIWFFGALVGLLVSAALCAPCALSLAPFIADIGRLHAQLPRPKWMSGKTSLLATFPILSKTLLVCHAALILR
jgi:hypothetical protein